LEGGGEGRGRGLQHEHEHVDLPGVLDEGQGERDRESNGVGADQNGLLGEPVHERCNQGCDADVGDHLDRQRGAEHRSGGISGDLEREQSEGNGEQAGADKGDDLGEEQRPVGAVA
jgi:hypothetical protein